MSTNTNWHDCRPAPPLVGLDVDRFLASAWDGYALRPNAIYVSPRYAKYLRRALFPRRGQLRRTAGMRRHSRRQSALSAGR
jgi:hypothetical protein